MPTKLINPAAPKQAVGEVTIQTDPELAARRAGIQDFMRLLADPKGPYIPKEDGVKNHLGVADEWLPVAWIVECGQLALAMGPKTRPECEHEPEAKMTATSCKKCWKQLKFVQATADLDFNAGTWELA